MGSNAHKQSQPSRQKPACSKKSRTRWTFARGCKASAAICCDCDLRQPITQDTEKIFCPPKKRAWLKTKHIRKVVIFISIPDALSDLHTFKYKRPRTKSNDGCLWKPTKRNNFRTSKQLRFVASTETIRCHHMHYLENLLGLVVVHREVTFWPVSSLWLMVD